MREVVLLAGEAVSSSSVGSVMVEDLFRCVDGSGRRMVMVLRAEGSLSSERHLGTDRGHEQGHQSRRYGVPRGRQKQ